MIERKLFQDTFSALHASEKSIQEVLAMSEEKKNTAARFRRPRRALLTAAAVAVIVAACARIREINGGEEDDLSQY